MSKELVLLQPDEYFHSMLSGAMDELSVDASEHAKYYLVSLLSNFMSLDNLYPKDGDGNRVEELAILFAGAIEADNNNEKSNRLKQLGDLSLYIAGFFSDSLSKKVVDVDYYINMGETAYFEVSGLSNKKVDQEIFAELSDRFPSFVEVFSQISGESFFRSDDNNSILRAYDLWVKTGSKRLEKQLSEAGIVLEKDKKLKKVQ